MRKLYALMLSLQILLASAIGLSSELAAQERPTDANIIGHITDAKTGNISQVSPSLSRVRPSVRLPMPQGTTSSRTSSRRA